MEAISETKLKMQTSQIDITTAQQTALCDTDECQFVDALVESEQQNATEQSGTHCALKRSTTNISSRTLSSSVTCLKNKPNEVDTPLTITQTSRTPKLAPSTHSLRSNNAQNLRAMSVRNASNLTHKSSNVSTAAERPLLTTTKTLAKTGLNSVSSKSSISMNSRVKVQQSRDSLSKPATRSAPLSHRAKLETKFETTNSKLEKPKIGQTAVKSVASTPRTGWKQKSFVRTTSKPVLKANENSDVWKEAESEVGDDVDLESGDIKELERKANMCVSNCIRIMKKLGNGTSFRLVMNNIETKTVLPEKLKGVSLLVDKLCTDHMEKRDAIKNLEEKLKQQNIQLVELKSKVTHMKANMQERTLGRNVLMTNEIEIELRDKEIYELKKKLEENKTVLEDYKKNHIEKNDDIRKLNEILNTNKKSYEKLQDEYIILQNELINAENKFNEQQNLSKKSVLQERNDELTLEVKQKTEECSEALHKAKQYFDEMMSLRQQVAQLQKLKSEAEEKIEFLENELKEFNNMKTYLDNMTNNVKDLELEFAKVRQSEKEKKVEIENLKIELYKSKATIEQLEDQINRDKHLLEVRGDFINSLQENNTDQRKRLDQMFANGTSNSQLSTELRAKETDYQTLFSTLGSKSMDLNRQAQQIQLLQETNERNQLLRVKQEEKIGRLEDEITRLKSAIQTLEAPSLIELTDYPIFTERRKKRNKKIHVRTYTT